MIRLTPEQARLVFGQKRAAAAPAARVRRRKEELPENIVEQQICDFLRLKGWRLYRQHVGAYMPYGAAMQAFKDHRSPGGLLIRIGENGMPDWRAERPDAREIGLARVFHFETKAPGAKPSTDQLRWMRHANATGTSAEWFDSFDHFHAWYQRRFPGECA